MEMGKAKYVVEESDEEQGHRVRLELPNGETYVSNFHALKKQAEYAVAEVALRRSECFKLRSVSKDAQQQLPIVRFDGECLKAPSQEPNAHSRVTVVKDEAAACEALAAFADELDRFPVMGFDTETQPHYYRVPGTPSDKAQPALPELLQIASEQHAIIFHMRHLNNKVPEPLARIFANERVMKLGSGISADAMLLRRFVPDLRPNAFVDLARFAVKFRAYPHGLQATVQALTGVFLNGRLSKKLQTSNWGAPKLTEHQVTYAATDAWVALKIYRAICQCDETMAHARIRAVLAKAGLHPDLYIPAEQQRDPRREE